MIGRGGNTPDGVNPPAKVRLKIVLQLFGRSRIDRKEQFIILTPTYSRLDIAIDSRHALDIHLGTALRCTQDVTKIGCQTIREIHHCVNLGPATKPLTLCHLCYGVAMNAGIWRIGSAGQNIP